MIRLSDLGIRSSDHRRFTLAALLTIPLVAVGWTVWPPPFELSARLARDTTLYLLVPIAVLALFPRDIGLHVDREVIAATVLLTVAVLPIYIVAASLPTVRRIYPLWDTSLALPEFLLHAATLFVLVAAVETYYRGLLCVGLRHLGPVGILVHLPLYVYVHLPHGPLEVVASAGAGLLFGAIAYRTESIVPTVTAHFVGLLALDLFVLLPPIVPWF